MEDSAHEQALYSQALEKPTAERAGFLATVCGEDHALRRRVEALLAAREQADTLLATALGEGRTRLQGDAPETTGEAAGKTGAGALIAGRYTLREKIGEGGMGEVWVASQTEPVKRQVALKLIRPGMDSKAVVQRFEQERQALAVMDHANIARVIDGGLTSTGQPFFVMELVQGLPLHQFCDEARLTPRERLELFVPICQAVQHAHQKGIVHRDLKPANILVTSIEGKPVPKVIDFGVAKATAGKLTDVSMATQFGAVIGTLEYMAPEQAGGEDIDTRADIYALGGILYELLTGLRPIRAQRLERAALAEMLRIVQEEDPEKPSTRLLTEGSLPSLAALRRIEPRKLMTLLHGELDWVVMKCLEKQRVRRYQTANALAREIERYLADEPVEARPPSTSYRLQKFVRRNKVQVVAASLLLLMLLGGIVGTSLGLVRARWANAQLALEQDKVQARFELAQKAIATFHTGVSEDVLLKNEQFKELRTRLLKHAAAFYGDLEKLLEGQADAKSRRLLGEGYFQLGDLTDKIGSLAEALGLQRKALAVRRELAARPGADLEARLDVARSLRSVGVLLRATGDTAGALRAWEEQRDIVAALATQSPIAAIQEIHAPSYHSIGLLLWGQDKSTEALAAYAKARDIRQKLVEANPAVTQFQSDLAVTHHNVALVLGQTGKQVEAMASFERAREIYQKLVEVNPGVWQFQFDLAMSHNSIGWLLFDMTKLAEALVSFEQARDLGQRVLEANPAVTKFQSQLAYTHQCIAGVLKDMGNTAAALTSFDKAREIEQKLIEANPGVTQFQSELAWTYNSAGALLAETGNPAEALAFHEKARDIQQKVVDTDPALAYVEWELAWSINSVAEELLATGRMAEALISYEQTRAIVQKLADAEPAVNSRQEGVAIIHINLAELRSQTGKPAEALAAFGKAGDILRRLVDANPSTTRFQSELAMVHRGVGAVLSDTSKPREAEAEYHTALALFQKLADEQPAIPGDQRQLARIQAMLGQLHARQQRFAAAFSAFEIAVAIGQKLHDTHPALAEYTAGLGVSLAWRGAAHVRAGHPIEGAADLRQAIGLFGKLRAPASATQLEWPKALAILAGLGANAKSDVTGAEAAAFADQALAALQLAQAADWAKPAELQQPEFDPLRDRDDFRAALAAAEFREKK